MNTGQSNGAFLICGSCDYCCYMRGPQARAIADDPPPCPGCGSATHIARRAPWSEHLRSLRRGA